MSLFQEKSARAGWHQLSVWTHAYKLNTFDTTNWICPILPFRHRRFLHYGERTFINPFRGSIFSFHPRYTAIIWLTIFTLNIRALIRKGSGSVYPLPPYFLT